MDFAQLRKTIDSQLISRGLPPIESDVNRLGLSPYPAWALSSACFASSIAALRGTPGWPGMFPLAGFAGAFAVSGYATLLDQENGPSTATAWGLCYMFFCGRSTLASLRPAPVLLTTAVLGHTYIYGKEFVDLWI